MLSRISDPEKVIQAIIKDIRAQLDFAVVGMSGGADSTLCAILCREALGAQNVCSVHMPYGDTDHTFFNARSLKTATQLGIHKLVIPIRNGTDALVAEVENALGAELSPLLRGNARSRERMQVLYAVNQYYGESQGKRSRVIGTGNLSEDFIGYDTKFGDAAADLFIIGELIKPEVYQLLDFFRDRGLIREDMIDRVPSAGLWENQSDAGELGHSYDAMAPAVLQLQQTMYTRCSSCGHAELRPDAADSKNDDSITLFVRQRHLLHRHKHMAPPVTKVFVP